MENKKARILALSSKGGHWMQLNRILQPLADNTCITFVSTFNNNSVSHCNYIQIIDFSRSTWWRLPLVLLQILKIIRAYKPTHIITTGAAPGLIAVVAGRLTRRKTLWIDSVANTSSLSLSGKMARFIATATLSQWSAVAAKYGNVDYAGNLFDNIIIQP